MAKQKRDQRKRNLLRPKESVQEKRETWKGLEDVAQLVAAKLRAGGVSVEGEVALRATMFQFDAAKAVSNVA